MLATRFPSFAPLRFFKVSLTKSVVFARYSLRRRSVGAPCYCAKIFSQYLLNAALRTPSLPIYDQSRYKSDDKRIVLLLYRSYSHRWIK